MEPELLSKRVGDALEIAARRAVPHFVGFLTEEEAALAKLAAERLHGRFCLWGGYDGAERQVFCALPDWCEPDDAAFPIAPLTLTFRACDTLSHRDVLGALMGQGLTREAVGDILLEPGRAVVFLLAEVAPFVTSQLETVGRAGVRLTAGFDEPLPGRGTLLDVTETVASARLDCVIAALLRCGRSQAEALLAEGRVRVNALACEKGTRQIRAGDTVSVRGYGKFAVDAVQDRTKKGRIVLRAKKYI